MIARRGLIVGLRLALTLTPEVTMAQDQDGTPADRAGLGPEALAAVQAFFAYDPAIPPDARIVPQDAVVNIWPGEGDTTQRNWFALVEICEQTVRDARRGLDYLQGRPEIDSERLGAFGYSMGAWQMPPLASVEPAPSSGWSGMTAATSCR